MASNQSHRQGKHEDRTAKYLTCSIVTIFSPYLVELKDVQKFKELAVLLVVLELAVVLLQSVQGQLGVVINVHLHGLQCTS